MKKRFPLGGGVRVRGVFGRRGGGGNTAPVLSGFDVTGDVIGLTASEDATCYWLVDSNATRTGAQVEAGGGEASGSFAVTTGTNDEMIDLSAVDPGAYWLHVVLKDAGGLYSSVTSEVIEIAAPASPAFVQSLGYSDQSFNANCELVMPGTVTSGSTLIAIMTLGIRRTVTAPAGWSLVNRYDHQGGTDSDGETYVYTKTAAGTEGGTTVTWTTDLSVKSAFELYELTLPVGTVETQAGTTYDPPSLTPSGGSREYVWIAFASHYATGYENFTAAPSGYGSLITARTDPGLNGGSGERTLGAAHKISTASSENPGLFTYSATPDAVRRVSLTIAAW